MHQWELPSIIFLSQCKGRFINNFFKSSNIYYISLFKMRCLLNKQFLTEVPQCLFVTLYSTHWVPGDVQWCTHWNNNVSLWATAPEHLHSSMSAEKNKSNMRVVPKKKKKENVLSGERQVCIQGLNPWDFSAVVLNSIRLCPSGFEGHLSQTPLKKNQFSRF